MSTWVKGRIIVEVDQRLNRRRSSPRKIVLINLIIIVLVIRYTSKTNQLEHLNSSQYQIIKAQQLFIRRYQVIHLQLSLIIIIWIICTTFQLIVRQVITLTILCRIFPTTTTTTIWILYQTLQSISSNYSNPILQPLPLLKAKCNLQRSSLLPQNP